ncbi:hypothetical protein E1165_02035 [Micromonospora sp. KC723]|nr:hypothetical protein E1165_02035 [Micromonospora sp. KC723]
MGDQRRGETGGEGQHGVEDVAVDQPDRQSVRRPVGEPADEHAGDRILGEDLLQHPVDATDVGTEARTDQVPGRRGRLRRHEQQALLVGDRQHQLQCLPW